MNDFPPGLIRVAEVARRIGVSGSAVTKAIDAGRIKVVGYTASDNKPLLGWPQVLEDWKANTNENKRTHIGSSGSMATGLRVAAAQVSAGDAPEEAKPVPAVLLSVPSVANPPSGDGEDDGGELSYADARAKRERYQAELARLEFEEKSGKLVDAIEVERKGRKLASAVISALYTIPDRISDEIAGMSDANEIQAVIIAELDRSVSELRAAYESE